MKITFNENGCYVIETGGPLVLRRGDDEELIERERIALCRCGQSGNKPFCDGTHKKVGFTAAGGEFVPAE